MESFRVYKRNIIMFEMTGIMKLTYLKRGCKIIKAAKTLQGRKIFAAFYLEESFVPASSFYGLSCSRISSIGTKTSICLYKFWNVAGIVPPYSPSRFNKTLSSEVTLICCAFL